MRYRGLGGVLAGMLMFGLVAVPVHADPPSLTFRTVGNATAGWAQTSDSDGDGWAVNLVLLDTSGQAFIDVPVRGRPHLPDPFGSPPSAGSPVDFHLKGTEQGTSQPFHGGPTLTVQFSDNTSATLSPGIWFTFWGSAYQLSFGDFLQNGGWSLHGFPSTCGPSAVMTYSQVFACASHKTVSRVFIASFPDLGRTTNIYIDAISFQRTFTMPQGKARKEI